MSMFIGWAIGLCVALGISLFHPLSFGEGFVLGFSLSLFGAIIGTILEDF